MIKDLEGIELEIGTIYIVPGDTTRVVFAKFTHETESSYIFKGINHNQLPTGVSNWKRQISKWEWQTTIPVIRASQTIIDLYGLC